MADENEGIARPTPRSAFGTLSAILATCARYWRANRRIAARHGSHRATNRTRLAAIYGTMTAEDFEALNGPQDRLNAFAIPRALSDHPDPRPWRIVDLGCGTGASSALLLRHAPPGSSLVGYDLCENLLACARARAWRDRRGRPLAAMFVCGAADEPLRRPQGALVAPGSIDVAHAAGLVGHHFEVAAARRLAAELDRILATDGIAVLDAGPRLGAGELASVMAEAGFERIGRHRLWPFASRMALTFGRRVTRPALAAVRG
ncbi:MAG: methyltransferase domain-containing protein [Planctomycetes bacterium]|nr:methyltransferase domain-containing protein [Planctomycetota bacterium]